MLSRAVLVSCIFVLTRAILYEGDQCNKDGFVGTCVNLGLCSSAIKDLRNRKNPQICSYDNVTPIVCCLDHAGPAQTQRPPAQTQRPPAQTQPPIPVATTTKRPSSTTTEYVPMTYDYVNVDQSGQCEPIPTSMTSPKTGQKAWDKCVEYQEQLVYPCERGVSLAGDLSRSNHCHHNADELIVGGTSANANEFPHMVMLGYGPTRDSLQWLCGGTLISDRYILTAGHCIAGNAENGPVTHVLVGALSRRDAADDSKLYKVKQIIKHPNYKSPYKYHDIALLETEKQIKLDQFTVPACLHVGDPVDDTKASVTGWGLTQYKGSFSEALQKVNLKKFTTAECSIKFPEYRLMKRGFDSETQYCYGDKTMSKDTCQGDSGGPLQIKSKSIHCMYVIIGVTSFGKACGFVGDPGIYTRVAPYLPWIESVVWP